MTNTTCIFLCCAKRPMIGCWSDLPLLGRLCMNEFAMNFVRYTCQRFTVIVRYEHSLRSIHSHFVHSISNSIIYGRSLWCRLDQCTYILYRMTKGNVFNIICIWCLIRCNFVIKQLVQKISALIESISKRLTVEFEIEWTKQLWIDP